MSAIKNLRQMQITLKALAEPRRMAVLTLVLSRHELRADEIASRFRSIRAGISQRFRGLTKQTCCSKRRQGTSRLYSRRTRRLRRAAGFFGRFWEGSLSRLKREVEAEALEAQFSTSPLVCTEHSTKVLQQVLFL
jgi:hypothetical protein